jgi:hypothetical protein
MECLQFTANITTFVPVMAFRNQTISICKGIAIILMVIGHADCPGLLGRFLYEFHMPLFFITAGYFFNLKYLDDEKTFVVKRLKGLYLPFLKWSILFTLLHNVFFKLNIINDQFGNGTKGGVAHLYSWHDIQRNILYSVTQMGGYDVFLNGAFWFFRALLISSIAYLVLFKLLRKNSWLRCENAHIAANRTGITVCLVMLLWSAWKTGCNLPITNIPQGGYRELMGTFFFGVGFLLHENPRFLHTTWWTCAGCFAIVLGVLCVVDSRHVVVLLFRPLFEIACASHSGFYNDLSFEQCHRKTPQYHTSFSRLLWRQHAAHICISHLIVQGSQSYKDCLLWTGFQTNRMSHGSA